jgi:hypothetical protein
MSTNLRPLLVAAGACLAIASGAAYADDLDQLAATAGLEASEIEGLTLTEVAAYKFNRDSIGQRAAIEPGSNGTREQLAESAGLTADDADGMTLTVIAAYHFNRGSSGDDQQTIRGGSRVTMASRSLGASQLAREAGLTEAEAETLSLRQIAAHVFNRGGPAEDWQRTDLP